MPDERLITEIENMLAQIITLGGANEITTIVPNVVIVDANPAGLTNFCIITDPRDGDNVPAKKVPGVIYSNSDLVNVLFIEGTEPIAFQQGSGSSGSAVAVSKLVSPDETIDPVFSADNSGHSTAVNDVSADNFAFIVENTSGAAAVANEVGYINEDGEYKTTTTQFNDVEWCVVIQGGANNSDIYVSRRGRVTVELDGNCSIGDKLYTSTTAGQANPQSYMRPEMFAVALTANASGAGGTCEALLYTGRNTIGFTSSNDTVKLLTASDSDFVSTIAAAGVIADKIYYNAPSSGNVDTISVSSTSELGKIVIHNTTQVDEAFIIATGTDGTGNFIQVSAAADIAAWIATDAITARSQTNTSTVATSSYWYDLEIVNELPELTTHIGLTMSFLDTGAVSERGFIHPFASSSVPDRQNTYNGSTTSLAVEQAYMEQALIQNRLCILWTASGTGTVRYILKLRSVVKAVP
jgi:hypothetical protein